MNKPDTEKQTTNGQRSDEATCSVELSPVMSYESMKSIAEANKSELLELRAQIRAMVKAKGRYNTQMEMEKLISMVPEL